MSSNLWAQTETLPQGRENNQNLFYKQVIIEILCELTKKKCKNSLIFFLDKAYFNFCTWFNKIAHDILEDKIEKYGVAFSPGMQEANSWLYVLTTPTVVGRES